MQTETQEWPKGWRTVAAGFFGMSAVTAVPTVLGIVLQPIVAETGWPRALISAQIFLLSAATLLLAPLAGRIVHRYGVRRYAIFSVAAAAPALLLITVSTATPALWIAVWILFAVINVGLGPLLWSTAVSQLFDRSRGLALAIALSGAGLAYAIQPIAVLIEASHGWRAVYYTLAGVFLLILLPIQWMWFKSRADLDHAAGEPDEAEHPTHAPAEGLTLREAMVTRQFWQLAAVCILVAAVEGAFIVNLFPILSEGGLDRTLAGTMGSAMGLAMVVGRLLTGAALDRLPPLLVVATAIMIIFVSAFLAADFRGSIISAAAIAILLGFGGGGITGAMAFLAGRHFGLAAYASIFGLLMGMFSIGYGIAPIIANHVRDVSGSYHAMFPTMQALLVLAAILTVLLGKPRPRPART